MPEQDRRVALVTGGTSGIGLAIVKTLAAAQHNVFLCARNAENVASTVKELREQGHDIDGAACDVRSTAEVRALVQTAVDRFGPVDVLVNNAGRSGGGVTADLDDEPLAGRHRHQPQQRVPGDPRGAERGRDAHQEPRPHHQHRLDGRKAGRGARGTVLGVQARRRRIHQGAGKRTRPDRDHRQRDLPRLCGNPDGATGQAGLRRGLGYVGAGDPRQRSTPRSRWAAIPRRTRSPGWPGYLASDVAASITAQAVNVCGGLGNF